MDCSSTGTFVGIELYFSRKLQELHASDGTDYRQLEDGARELYLAARSLCEAATREQIRERSLVTKAAALMQQAARCILKHKAVAVDSTAASCGREIKQLRKKLLAGTR